MFLDLNNIGPSGLEFDRTIRVPDLEGARGVPVRVLSAAIAGEIVKAAVGFDLEARLRAEVETGCSRCLEPCRIVLANDVRLVLVPSAAPGDPEAAGRRLDEAEEAERFDCPEGQVDLVQLVSEQIYLGLPLKPVCRDDCRGLCPQCGVNRNVETCECKSESVDPRLAGLQRLRDMMKG